MIIDRENSSGSKRNDDKEGMENIFRVKFESGSRLTPFFSPLTSFVGWLLVYEDTSSGGGRKKDGE